AGAPSAGHGGGAGAAVLRGAPTRIPASWRGAPPPPPPARPPPDPATPPRHSYYSGIGGTTPQVLVNGAAEQILAGELGVALVCGAEALATQRRYERRGERYPYRFKPEERRPFPWEAPFHPAEVAHEVFQAWL